MMPLRLYAVHVVGVSNAGNFVMGALAMGLTAFLPTFVQGAMGLTAVLAGATLGVMSAFWTVGSLIVSRFLIHVPYRTVALMGSVLLVGGTVALIMLEPDRSIWWALIGGAVIGVGFGFINIVFVVMTQAAVGWKERGAATASNQFMRQLGASIGTAAFGAVFNLGLYARIPNAGDVVTQMMNPLTRSRISPFDVETYAGAIAASLHGIFIMLALLAVIVLLLAVALPAEVQAEEPTPA
jgi:MFS family permease